MMTILNPTSKKKEVDMQAKLKERVMLGYRVFNTKVK